MKITLEKAKQQLEAEKVEAKTEAKQLATYKQDSDKQRKQLEQQLQEYTIKFADTDKTKTEMVDKVSKLQVRKHSFFLYYVTYQLEKNLIFLIVQLLNCLQFLMWSILSH